MRILDVLEKAGLAVNPLRAVLGKVGDALPDLKDEADAILAKLDAPVALENLAALAVAVPAELAEIVKGKVDPREHPSDAA